MEMPFYQVPGLGNGMVIALDAVLHVCISHGLAIGAFAMVLLADHRRRRAGPPLAEAWEHFDRDLLKFIVVITTTVGAVTGAGIWFSTGTLAPRGIASMLRVFFWPWWIEWIVFVLEVISLLLLWLGWDRLGARPGRRLRVGLAYLGLVAMSGVLISGILAFMLTPGGWPVERRLVAAFFNPSFPPQLLLRLLLAGFLGGLVALTWAALGPHPADLKRDALRLFGGATAALLPFLVGVAGWWALVVPEAYLERLTFSVVTGRFIDWAWILGLANAVALAVFVALVGAGLARRIRWTGILAVPALVLAVGVVAEFERVREFVRGPYLMPGYMYVGGVLLEEVPVFRQAGLLPANPWFRPQAGHGPYAEGAYAFARSCGGCHTLHGINAITDRVAGRSEDGIYVLLGRASEMVGFMPPFAGSDSERRAVARYLWALSQGRVAFEVPARHRTVAVPAPPRRDEEVPR